MPVLTEYNCKTNKVELIKKFELDNKTYPWLFM